MQFDKQFSFLSPDCLTWVPMPKHSSSLSQWMLHPVSLTTTLPPHPSLLCKSQSYFQSSCCLTLVSSWTRTMSCPTFPVFQIRVFASSYPLGSNQVHHNPLGSWPCPSGIRMTDRLLSPAPTLTVQLHPLLQALTLRVHTFYQRQRKVGNDHKLEGQADRPGFESHYTNWASYFSSINLHFLICQWRIILCTLRGIKHTVIVQ